jgi:YfiH family protein
VAGASEFPVLVVDLGDGVRAAFTGRSGGESPEPWESLNLGLGVDDDRSRVLRNRERAGGWLGAPVVFATQVHGAGVGVVLDDGFASAGFASARFASAQASGTWGEHDALVTAAVGVGLGVLAADCVPVLLADPVARVVGVVHAGRRGLVAGVVRAGLATMREHGADLARTRAVVGPSACGTCYEVPAEMRADVAATHPATWSTTSWGTPALDLPAGVAAELLLAGVQVTRTDVCTITDERFFSHRRAAAAGATTGRFAGMVALVP